MRRPFAVPSSQALLHSGLTRLLWLTLPPATVLLTWYCMPSLTATAVAISALSSLAVLGGTRRIEQAAPYLLSVLGLAITFPTLVIYTIFVVALVGKTEGGLIWKLPLAVTALVVPAGLFLRWVVWHVRSSTALALIVLVLGGLTGTLPDYGPGGQLLGRSYGTAGSVARLERLMTAWTHGSQEVGEWAPPALPGAVRDVNSGMSRTLDKQAKRALSWKWKNHPVPVRASYHASLDRAGRSALWSSLSGRDRIWLLDVNGYRDNGVLDAKGQYLASTWESLTLGWKDAEFELTPVLRRRTAWRGKVIPLPAGIASGPAGR